MSDVVREMNHDLEIEDLPFVQIIEDGIQIAHHLVNVTLKIQRQLEIKCFPARLRGIQPDFYDI